MNVPDRIRITCDNTAQPRRHPVTMILVSDADTGEQLSNVLEVAVHMLRDKLSANVTFLGKGSGTGSDSRWFTVAYEWPNVELDLRAVRQTTEA